ncbi:MAG: hypothetical protein WCP96_12515 [Methylococcaceae bacterium]
MKTEIHLRLDLLVKRLKDSMDRAEIDIDDSPITLNIDILRADGELLGRCKLAEVR